MLGLFIVRILAAISIASLVAGFLLGHGLSPVPRATVHVVAKRDSARWTGVVWVGGALIAAFWSTGVLVAPEYAYDWPSLPGFAASSVIQLLGFFVSLAGGLLFFAAVRALGRHMTPAIQVEEGHRLVQEGPYRYVRHPAYSAILTGAAGVTILYLSLPLALVTLVLFVMAFYRAHLEEELLSSPEAFGTIYTAYVARTGRFLPRFRPRT